MADRTIDKFESLGGRSLVSCFDAMDSLLWRALSLLVQEDPHYIQRHCLVPLIREITGTSHGRRWFVVHKDKAQLTKLLEVVRVWMAGVRPWPECLRALRSLGLYRDTLRSWVENAQPTDVAIVEHVRNYHKRYLHYRTVITEAYLPLVWRVASTHGFSEDVKADLFQIGTTGLIHAAERYYNVGPVTFSTFAARWVKQAVLMYISRKMPIIPVSHSVLEEDSRLRRKERETGVEDDSAKAQRIRRLAGTKDVMLVEDVEAEQEATNDPIISLGQLPRTSRQILILRHGLLERAAPHVDRKALEAERNRQFNVMASSL